VVDFLKIVECGNYSKAADELYISQSVLSKHIQAIEKTLGVELFNRSTRKITLSKAGKIFLPYANQLQTTFLQASKDLQTAIAEDYMKLSIGCIPVMIYYNMTDIISAFHEKYPEINISLYEYYRSGESFNKILLDFEVELVFCDAINSKDNRYESVTFCEDHLVAILNKSHHLAGTGLINLKLLKDENLLFMHKATPTYKLSNEICEKAGFTPNVFFYGGVIEDVLALVEKNMGVAILMKNFVHNYPQDNIVIREISPTAKRKIDLVHLAKRRFSTSAQLFWDYMQKWQKEKLIQFEAFSKPHKIAL
jgi:DNA-binding transcriptional LysR family regulator